MHACLTCDHFTEPDVPMSMTSGAHLHIGFWCINFPTELIPDPTSSGSMIYDIVDDAVWHDGGPAIHVFGCRNYKRNPLVNPEVCPFCIEAEIKPVVLDNEIIKIDPTTENSVSR